MEYVDVLYKLWEGSWDEDALRADKQAGVHPDAAKIHEINHVGEHFSVEGPALRHAFAATGPTAVPGRRVTGGQRFSARNAEGVFISSPDPESARGLIDETRELAAGYGRDPYDVKFFQGWSLVVGRTSEEARDKEAQIEELLSVEGVLCHILCGTSFPVRGTGSRRYILRRSTEERSWTTRWQTRSPSRCHCPLASDGYPRASSSRLTIVFTSLRNASSSRRCSAE